MTESPPPPRSDGRSLRWRAGIGLAGLSLLAAGLGLVVWPMALVYAFAGVLGLLGAFLLVSAVAARGR